MMISVREEREDIVLVAGYTKKKSENNGFFTDKRKNAAIRLTCGRIGINSMEAGHGFVMADIKWAALYSVYISPNADEESMEEMLYELARNIRGRICPILVAGDFNAKAPMWRESRLDVRAERLAHGLAELNLEMVNDGQTFEGLSYT